MKKFEEFATAWADVFPRNPFDPAAVYEAARKSLETGEALVVAGLKATGSVAELTGQWALESLERSKVAFRAGQDPESFSSAAKDLTSATVESAAEHIAAYTEIAKRTQIESAEIVLGAAK